MIFTIDIITILVATLLLIYIIKKIFRNKFSIIHVIGVTFYAVQVLPMIISPFFEWDAVKRITPYMYYAMCDEYISIIYDVFIITSMLLFAAIGDRYSLKAYKTNFDIKTSILSFKYGAIVYKVTCITMFLPVIAILFAPKVNVYLQYAYFVRNTVAYTSLEYLYHASVMSICKYIAFASIVINYLYKNRNKINFHILLAIALTTWIDGKRTVFTFCLIAILAIDFLTEADNLKRLKSKAMLFAILIVGYFLLYSLFTGKNANEDAFNIYTNYFSRLGHVKLAIYSRLYNNKIISYDGQSLLYNITFYIPRSVWENKPYGFYRYFTSYAFYGIPSKDVGINLQVNIFTEFIANFGFVGYLMAIAFVIVVAKKSERNNNFLVNAVGMIFLVLYSLFGFEGTVMISFLLWILLFIKSKFRIGT